MFPIGEFTKGWIETVVDNGNGSYTHILTACYDHPVLGRLYGPNHNGYFFPEFRSRALLDELAPKLNPYPAIDLRLPDVVLFQRLNRWSEVRDE